MTNIRTYLFLILLCSLHSAYSQTIHPLIQQSLDEQTEVHCILLFKGSADLSAASQQKTKTQKGQYVYQQLLATAGQSQAPVQAWLQQQAIPFHSYHIANAISLKADAAVLEQLSQFDEIAKILPNRPIQAAFPIAKPQIPTKNNSIWGLEKTQATRLWELGIRGQGTVLGGQDTGYDWDHPSIKIQYRGSENDHDYHWHDAIHERHPENDNDDNPCGFDAKVPCDDHSHGTHTVGTMVGHADNNDQAIGMAPEAQWIGCRNMERGWGLPSTYLECFEWFLAPTDLENNNPNPALAPHVINNSWSCPTIEGCNPANFEVMRIAVANLRAAGVVVVVSAGNSGPNCNTINAPAAIFEEAFVVGASDADDQIAEFSSRGAVTVDGSQRMKPDVVAPGVDVRSAILGDNYANWNGTSMAGPHVAGAVALLISADPNLAGEVDLIEEILEQTADPIAVEQSCNGISGAAQPNHSSGWGRINLWKALSIVRPDLVHNINKNSYQLRIFPNPNSGQFMLVAPEKMGPSTLRVYSALGQEKEILQQQLNFTSVQQIDLSNFPNGLYFLTITSNDSPQKTFTTKLHKRN